MTGVPPRRGVEGGQSLLEAPIPADRGGVGARGFRMVVQATDRNDGSNDQKIRGVCRGVERSRQLESNSCGSAHGGGKQRRDGKIWVIHIVYRGIYMLYLMASSKHMYPTCSGMHNGGDQ